MSKYAIEDTTLTAIGDALREKLGATHTEKVFVETIHHPEITKQMKPRIAKTPNAIDFTTRNGGYGNGKYIVIVHVYNRALSENEILQNYYSIKNRFNIYQRNATCANLN